MSLWRPTSISTVISCATDRRVFLGLKILGQLYLNRHFGQLSLRTRLLSFPRSALKRYVETNIHEPHTFDVPTTPSATPPLSPLAVIDHTLPPTFFALCFHELTNCFFRNPFLFRIICVAPCFFVFRLATARFILRSTRQLSGGRRRPSVPVSRLAGATEIPAGSARTIRGWLLQER
jgi:hypothetical protein